MLQSLTFFEGNLGNRDAVAQAGRIVNRIGREVRKGSRDIPVIPKLRTWVHDGESRTSEFWIVSPVRYFDSALASAETLTGEDAAVNVTEIGMQNCWRHW